MIQGVEVFSITRDHMQARMDSGSEMERYDTRGGSIQHHLGSQARMISGSERVCDREL